MLSFTLLSSLFFVLSAIILFASDDIIFFSDNPETKQKYKRALALFAALLGLIIVVARLFTYLFAG